MDFTDEHIWIIGASCGIGQALACYLAEQGACLALSARNQSALQTLAQKLEGEHAIYPLDASDANALQAASLNITSERPLDRIIYMAAVYQREPDQQSDAAFCHYLMQVNLCGAIYTSYLARDIFFKQGHGQLVLCASMAGLLGMPTGQPYSASKAGLINFAESFYAETADYMDVKLINPGFVKTRITDKNKFYMPCLIDKEKAAKAIGQGLLKRRFEIHFPKTFTYFIKVFSILPYWIQLPLCKWVARKIAQ